MQGQYVGMVLESPVHKFLKCPQAYKYGDTLPNSTWITFVLQDQENKGQEEEDGGTGGGVS